MGDSDCNTVIISILTSLVIKENPINVVGYLFDGAFSRPVKFLFDAAILLAFGVAIIPCFKMKYWNMGANGQFLIACIISMLLMKGMEDFGKEGTFQNIVVIITMLVVSTSLDIIEKLKKLNYEILVLEKGTGVKVNGEL